MMVSLVDMPSFTLREEGTIHQVDDATAAAWVAAGLAAVVIDDAGAETASVETASVQAGENAAMPRAPRRRG